MRLNLNFRPRTVGQHAVYYSVCVLLASPCWSPSGVFGKVMMGVDAVIVLAVAGLMVAGRSRCRA
jgi:hypothetical protein